MTDNKAPDTERPANPHPLRRAYLERDFKIVLTHCAVICLLLHLWVAEPNYIPPTGLHLTSWQGVCDLCSSAQDLLTALGLFLLLRLSLSSVNRHGNVAHKILSRTFLALVWLARKTSAVFVLALCVTVALLLVNVPLSLLFPVAMLTALMGFSQYAKPRPSPQYEAMNDLLDRFLVVRECLYRLGFEHQVSSKRFALKKEPSPACLSIEGPWGSGKSFILNQVCHHLQECGQTIAFVSPWSAKSADECLSELVETLERAATGYDPLCSRCRQNSVLSLLTLGLTKSDDVTSALSSLIQTPSADDDSRLDLLDKELGKTGSIYLIIDDSERSNPETFHRLLPVMERLKRLKKIHVIAAFNTEVIREMFRESGRNSFENCAMADGYLNKVFTYRLRLPDADSYTKEGFIRHCIDRCCQGQANEEKMKEILGKALTYDGASEQSPFFAPNYPRTTELGIDLVVTYLQMELWHYASDTNNEELIQNVKDLFFFTCLKNEFPHVYDEVSHIIIKVRGQKKHDTQLEAYADTISGAEASKLEDFPATYEAQRNDSAYTDYKRYLTARLSMYKSKLANPFQELMQTRSDLFRIISYTYRTHTHFTFEEKKNITEHFLKEKQESASILRSASEVLHYDASNSPNVIDLIIDFMIGMYVHGYAACKVTLSDLERVMHLYEKDIHINKIDCLNEGAFMNMISSWLREVNEEKRKRMAELLLVWKNYLPKEALLIGYATESHSIKQARKATYPQMDLESIMRELERQKDLLDTVFLPFIESEYFSGKKLWSEEERLAISKEPDLLDLFPQPHTDVDKMNIFLILCDFHLHVCSSTVQGRAFCEEANNMIYSKLLPFTVASETDICANLSEKDRTKADNFIRVVFRSAQWREWRILLKDTRTYVHLLVSASKLERICLINEKRSTNTNEGVCHEWDGEGIDEKITKKNYFGWDIPWQEPIDEDEWVRKYEQYKVDRAKIPDMSRSSA